MVPPPPPSMGISVFLLGISVFLLGISVFLLDYFKHGLLHGFRVFLLQPILLHSSARYGFIQLSLRFISMVFSMGYSFPSGLF